MTAGAVGSGACPATENRGTLAIAAGGGMQLYGRVPGGKVPVAIVPLWDGDG